MCDYCTDAHRAAANDRSRAKRLRQLADRLENYSATAALAKDRHQNDSASVRDAKAICLTTRSVARSLVEGGWLL